MLARNLRIALIESEITWADKQANLERLEQNLIVKFHGYIFNRWGKKLFEWTDITTGWDGKYAGHDVADGVYFCHIEATGADGRKFKIKKAINLIRKYIRD